jgi:hypothetical protein
VRKFFTETRKRKQVPALDDLESSQHYKNKKIEDIMIFISDDEDTNYQVFLETGLSKTQIEKQPLEKVYERTNQIEKEPPSEKKMEKKTVQRTPINWASN